MMRSFREDFAQRCADFGHHRALIDAKTGRVWTYESLRRAVAGMGGVLQAAGVRPGARVLSVLPNGVEQLAAFLACWWIGADFCPVSPLATVEEMGRFAQLCRSTVGLVPQNIDARVIDRLRATARIERCCPIALDGDLTRYIDMPPGEGASAAHPSRLILFTSGTVANPKAMVIGSDRLWSSAVAWAGFHRVLDPESRFYNILPMSYLGGLFNLGLIPLACGGSVVISDAFSAGSALRFWHEVREHGVNVLWLAPTICRAVLALGGRSEGAKASAANIRVGFLGMAPSTIEEKTRFETALNMPLVENYALSETTFLTSEVLGEPRLTEQGAVGKPLPWVTLRVRPGADDAAAGEIEAQTPYLFEGYLEPSGDVRCPLTPDGFLATGDIGVLRPDGHLCVRGRLRDVVKKGGYLLLLSELEEVAAEHPAVAESAAIPIPHDFYGESAVLCVRVSQPTAVTPQVTQDLVAFVTRNLAKFKWPDKIAVCTAFPKTESGKIQKRVLWEQIQSGTNVVAMAVVK